MRGGSSGATCRTRWRDASRPAAGVAACWRRVTEVAARLTVREILHPRAVAVFGASEDRDKFGGRIIDFLIRHGFAGRIVPINPRRAEIRGHPAFARLTDAPRGVDVAILAVPAAHLLPPASAPA